MAQQNINVSTPNDNLGDPIRTAFIKSNENFTELYSAILGLGSATYIIETTGIVFYAYSYSRAGLPSYSSSSFNTLMTNVLAQLAALTPTGGRVFIRRGSYTGLDQISIPCDNVTIEGEGKYVTKLVMAAGRDASYGARFALIKIDGYDNCIIRNIEIDGNGSNQTKIDAGASVNAIEDCIYTHNTYNTLIENCYIHDCTMTTIETHGCDDTMIRGCHIKNGYWNGITFGWGTINNHVTQCLVEGSGDVGIATYGSFNKITDNTIRLITGANGSRNTKCGISCEDEGGSPTTDHFISGNVIHGTGMISGISAPGATTAATERLVIQSNRIYDVDYGIYTAGNHAVIKDNFIDEAEEMAIHIQGGEYNNVMNNTLLCVASKYAIVLSTDGGTDYSSYNIVFNNHCKMASGTYVYCFAINANCVSNIIVNNIVYGASGEQVNISDAGTNTILRDNYGQSGLRWNPETGDTSINYAATATGATTGQIKPGSQYAYISSADANYICRLPIAAAHLVGTIIRGRVGSNGFELRTASGDEATVSINNVSGAGTEAAIPTLYYFEAELVTTTRWLLRAWDTGGNYVAITPDV